MMVNGLIIKEMVMENIFTSMELHMKVIGKMTGNTALEKKYGWMVPNMKENMQKEKRMGREN